MHPEAADEFEFVLQDVKALKLIFAVGDSLIMGRFH